MVRFSDIIKDGEKRDPDKESSELATEDENLGLSDSQSSRVMSDTQILKVRGQKASLDPSFKEEWNPEVIMPESAIIRCDRNRKRPSQADVASHFSPGSIQRHKPAKE